MNAPINTAMVLAAGLGKRMRPITDTLPKPLVQVGGRALVDHALDRLAEAGIGSAVVNVHYLADLIEAHLRPRRRPTVVVSDERGALLETGGGIRKALPLLGGDPFLVLNSDSLWIEGGGTPNLLRLHSGVAAGAHGHPLAHRRDGEKPRLSRPRRLLAGPRRAAAAARRARRPCPSSMRASPS